MTITPELAAARDSLVEKFGGREHVALIDIGRGPVLRIHVSGDPIIADLPAQIDGFPVYVISANYQLQV